MVGSVGGVVRWLFGGLVVPRVMSFINGTVSARFALASVFRRRHNFPEGQRLTAPVRGVLRDECERRGNRLYTPLFRLRQSKLFPPLQIATRPEAHTQEGS